MRLTAVILALLCVSAGGPALPQAKKKVAPLVSPKVASSSSATSRPMLVLPPRTNPPPRFSAAFNLTDPTNTLESIKFMYGSATSNYTQTIVAPMGAFTNSSNGYTATFQFTNLAVNQPIVMVAAATGTNGLTSLTNSGEIIWNMNAPVQVWLKAGAVHVSIRTVMGRRYWVYMGNEPNGPWVLGPILDGNGGIRELVVNPHQQEYFKVVEGQ